MKQRMDGCEGIRIVSPVTGNAVPVDQVPDPVFSQKIIGDGVAVAPEDGRIVSPEVRLPTVTGGAPGPLPPRSVH